MLTEVGSTPHSAVMLAARCMARVPVLSSSCRCAQVRTLQQLQESGHAAGQGQRHPHHVPALPAGEPTNMAATPCFPAQQSPTKQQMLLLNVSLSLTEPTLQDEMTC